LDIESFPSIFPCLCEHPLTRIIHDSCAVFWFLILFTTLVDGNPQPSERRHSKQLDTRLFPGPLHFSLGLSDLKTLRRARDRAARPCSCRISTAQHFDTMSLVPHFRDTTTFAALINKRVGNRAFSLPGLAMHAPYPGTMSLGPWSQHTISFHTREARQPGLLPARYADTSICLAHLAWSCSLPQHIIIRLRSHTILLRIIPAPAEHVIESLSCSLIGQR
jgi:hypothetical protein